VPRPDARPFRGLARFHSDEAIWLAQVVTWLPLVSQAVGIGALLVGIFGAGPLAGSLVALLPAAVIPLILGSLYGFAGAWIGARQSRGIWLAIALFALSLVMDVLSGRLLSFGAAYDLVALILVIRAGRAIGVRYLTSRA
jgi:hypothetical protein